MATDKAIKVENLVKRYKKSDRNAVDDISFDVNQGEFFAFLGPNGAGKTTTISILTTTLSLTSGNVEVTGLDIEKEANKVRENVGIIFQKPSLDLNLTAEENIRLHAVLYGQYPFAATFNMMSQDYKKQVMELAEVLGIASEIRKPVKTFSGGMKRKLEIVRSLMHSPKVLFLDEPTTGLDPESRRNLWDYLQKVRAEQGTTVFLTTHYLDEVEGADRVAIISKGQIVINDTPNKIKEQLVEEYVEMTTQHPAELMAELKQLGYDYKQVNPIKVIINGHSLQDMIKKIHTKIDRIDVHRPSLEEAYLKIIEREHEEEQNEDAN